MSTNPNSMDQSSTGGAQFSSEGLYDSSDLQEDTSLKVQLGEHLDRDTRRSLAGGEGMPTNAIMSFVKRNPIPLALAAGGLIWLLTSGSRRFRR